MRAKRAGCVLYNDYHQNIAKTYFNRRDFPFLSLSKDTPVAIDGSTCPCLVWLFFRRHTPSEDLGIPRAIQMMSSAELLGFPRLAATRWKQTLTHAPKRREHLFFFNITWAQIRFVFQVLNGHRMSFHGWPFYNILISMLDFAWEARCRATVYQSNPQKHFHFSWTNFTCIRN